MFDSLRPHGLWPARLLCPWDSPGKNTGVDCKAGDLGSIPGLGRSPGERRDWQPTPVFLPGEFYGQRSLVGYSPWGLKEWDTTEWLTRPLLLLLRHCRTEWFTLSLHGLFTLLPFLLLLCAVKETGIQTRNIVLQDSHPPSSRMPSFLNKVSISCLDTLPPDLLTCSVSNRTSLGLVTILREIKFSLSFLFFFFFFNFILFLNPKHCISFAKHQNESA